MDDADFFKPCSENFRVRSSLVFIRSLNVSITSSKTAMTTSQQFPVSPPMDLPTG